MLRCGGLVLAFELLSVSAIHSPSLKDDADSGQKDVLLEEGEDEAEDELDEESLLDVAEALAASDVGGDEIDEKTDDNDDSENDDDTGLDDDEDDDDDDDPHADDAGDDAELDALVNDKAEDNADNAEASEGKQNDDEDDEPDDEDTDDEDDNDDSIDDPEDASADTMPTLLALSSTEETQKGGFEFSAELPFHQGPTDTLTVHDLGRQQDKVTMVIVTKSSCPNCKQLAESMNEDPGMKAAMNELNAVHAPDFQGDAWHKEAGYVPRVYFYGKDGAQLDVHSPYAKYPYFFDTSKVLEDGIREALSLGDSFSLS